MSTRHAAFAHTSIVHHSTDANREFHRSGGEPISRNGRSNGKLIFRSDLTTSSSLSDPMPIVRQPLNDDTAVPSLDTQNAKWLKTDLTARDLMTVCTATLRPDDSIEQAARLMTEAGSGAIPVVDVEGRLIGVITNRDITMKLIALGASIPHAQVSDCMTSEAFACSADNSLESCVSAMSWHQVRRIPIVDDEHRVLGTISQRDLARYVSENPERVDCQMMAEILWALAY